jgi:hypothetical protein
LEFFFRRGRILFIKILIIAGLFTAPAFAKDNPSSSCAIELSNGALFHNSELANMAAQGLDFNSVQQIAKRLAHEGTFDIPTNNHGFVTAADVGDHPGNYGHYFWLRDLARIYLGSVAHTQLLKNLNLPWQEAARVQKERAQALAKILKTPLWTQQALDNIQNPGLHMDPDHGQQTSLWVRFAAKPFQENRAPTEEERRQEADWGHKQNDALATFGLTIISAVQNGDLRRDGFNGTARLNLDLLTMYFARLNYPRMWDMGSWEEELARRSHSISLVTSYLENFEQAFPREKFVDYDLVHGQIDEAYTLLRKRLLGKRLIEADEGTSNSFRDEDTAILHTLWWPLEKFTDSDYSNIIDKLDMLKRNSGYARYVKDWFLYGPAAIAESADKNGAAGHLLIPDNGNYRLATNSEIKKMAELHAKHMGDKDMKDLIALAGANFEAQWTLPDAILTSHFSDLYLQTYNPDHLAKAKEHYARLLGLVTGTTDVTSEGKPITPFRLPEAYLPVAMRISGHDQIVYYTSPNSPLNWATAEFTIATEGFLRALYEEAQSAVAD